MKLFSLVIICILNVQLWMFSDNKSTFNLFVRRKSKPCVRADQLPHGIAQLVSAGSDGSGHQSLMNGSVLPLPRAKVCGIKFIPGQNTTQRSKPFVRSFYLDLFPPTALPLRLCPCCMERYGLRQTT